MNELKKGSDNNPPVNKMESIAPKKSLFSGARLAAILSFLFMGLGQLYNKQYFKGISFLVLELYLLLFWTIPFQWAMWGLTTLRRNTANPNRDLK